jgi:hypothetical protein
MKNRQKRGPMGRRMTPKQQIDHARFTVQSRVKDMRTICVTISAKYPLTTQEQQSIDAAVAHFGRVLDGFDGRTAALHEKMAAETQPEATNDAP